MEGCVSIVQGVAIISGYSEIKKTAKFIFRYFQKTSMFLVLASAVCYLQTLKESILVSVMSTDITVLVNPSDGH